MSESLAQVAGIDVAKDHLDIHLHPSGATRRVRNNDAGHKVLLGWLARQRVERIVFEATGLYHRRFERALCAAGLPFAKITRARPGASPRRQVGSPRPIGSMPPCSPAWGRCCNRNPARRRASCSTN